MTVRISSFVEISTNGKYTPYADKMQEKFASLAKFVSPNWDLSVFSAPKAQKLLPGEKLAKIYDL